VSNERFAKEETENWQRPDPVGINATAAKMIAMVFWAALAQAATLPEIEKPPAVWTGALLAWLQA